MSHEWKKALVWFLLVVLCAACWAAVGYTFGRLV
jgi:hypothetical protein